MATAGRGPYVALAVFCDSVLEEKDGVLSLIRITDRWIVQANGTDAPGSMPSTQLDLTAVVALKSGSARGRATVRIRAETPAGVRLDAVPADVLFEGEGDRGANVVFKMGLEAKLEGLYWFDVFVDDMLVTRMPLRLIYQRLG